MMRSRLELPTPHAGPNTALPSVGTLESLTIRALRPNSTLPWHDSFGPLAEPTATPRLISGFINGGRVRRGRDHGTSKPPWSRD